MSAAEALTLPGVQTPPASLRLGVNVWGLDVSTRRISVGVLQGTARDEPPEIGWFSLDVEQHGGGAARLAWLHDALPGFLGKLISAAPPRGVLVEQPYGQGKARPHPQSYYVVGVVLCALALDLRDVATVEVVDPSSWKRDALGQGHGFARKPEILAWARAAGYPGDCPRCGGQGRDCDVPGRAHDEADALGVATCAGVRWAAGRSLR